MLAFYDENFKIDENSAWQNHSPLDFSFALILFAYLMPFHASHKYNKWLSIECKFKWMIARSRYRWLDSCSLQSYALCLFAFIILSRIRENVLQIRLHRPMAEEKRCMYVSSHGYIVVYGVQHLIRITITWLCSNIECKREHTCSGYHHSAP